MARARVTELFFAFTPFHKNPAMINGMRAGALAPVFAPNARAEHATRAVHASCRWSTLAAQRVERKCSLYHQIKLLPACHAFNYFRNTITLKRKCLKLCLEFNYFLAILYLASFYFSLQWFINKHLKKIYLRVVIIILIMCLWLIYLLLFDRISIMYLCTQWDKTCAII